jgi:putative oxidoreductase
MIRRMLDFGRTVADRFTPVAPLLTRLVVGYGFLLTGLGKLRNFEGTVAFFTEAGLPLPEVNAAFIGTLEIAGGALLMAGLLTRAFASLLSASMVVALLTADRTTFFAALTPGSDRALTDVVPLVFLLFLVWLVAYGAGPWSVDGLLRARTERRARRERLTDPLRPIGAR